MDPRNNFRGEVLPHLYNTCSLPDDELECVHASAVSSESANSDSKNGVWSKDPANCKARGISGDSG